MGRGEKEMRSFNESRGEKENRTTGLLEQWLQDKKISKEEALNEAIGIFMSGVDSVILK
jgi:dsDNA-binding SOS-regulon protein